MAYRMYVQICMHIQTQRIIGHRGEIRGDNRHLNHHHNLYIQRKHAKS